MSEKFEAERPGPARAGGDMPPATASAVIMPAHDVVAERLRELEERLRSPAHEPAPGEQAAPPIEIAPITWWPEAPAASSVSSGWHPGTGGVAREGLPSGGRAVAPAASGPGGTVPAHAPSGSEPASPASRVQRPVSQVRFAELVARQQAAIEQQSASPFVSAPPTRSAPPIVGPVDPPQPPPHLIMPPTGREQVRSALSPPVPAIHGPEFTSAPPPLPMGASSASEMPAGRLGMDRSPIIIERAMGDLDAGGATRRGAQPAPVYSGAPGFLFGLAMAAVITLAVLALWP